MLISLAGFKQSHITLLFLLRIDKVNWLVDFLPGVTSVTSFFVIIILTTEPSKGGVGGLLEGKTGDVLKFGDNALAKQTRP